MRRQKRKPLHFATISLSDIAGYRAAWFFAVVWIACSIYLLTANRVNLVVLCLTKVAIYTPLCILTLLMTKENLQQHQEKNKKTTLRCVFQAVVVATIIFFTVCKYVPCWSPFLDWIGDIGQKTLDSSIVGSGYSALRNPITYFVIPMVLLILLGAQSRQLGLGRGHRLWRVAAVWCSIPVVVILFALMSGRWNIGRLLKALVSNSLQNGFFEEFLFRGALQTRLAPLLSTSWAIVIQAIIFGAWHADLAALFTGGENALGDVAAAIINQGTDGMVYGIIFWRTRNLAASSIFHVLGNSAGQLL